MASAWTGAASSAAFRSRFMIWRLGLRKILAASGDPLGCTTAYDGWTITVLKAMTATSAPRAEAGALLVRITERRQRIMRASSHAGGHSPDMGDWFIRNRTADGMLDRSAGRGQGHL